MSSAGGSPVARGPFSGRGQGQQVVAPGANRSGLVLFLGISLIVVNMIADPAVRATFAAVVTKGGGHQLIAPAPGTPNLIDIGLQVGIVLLLAGVAAASDEAGSIAVALLIGLWLVFAVMRVDVIATAVKWVQARG